MGTAQRSRHMHRLVLLLAFAGLSISLASPSAQAATSSRAGVVVDLGNGSVHQVGITFSGTITGLQALQRAGFAPNVRSFGGMGGAVCALDVGGTTLGCPTDSSCLTCADPNYWVYFRAPVGTTSFSTSRAGAGSTSVGDGDIEGWRWGTGQAPRYVAIDALFPTVTTSTPVSTTVTTTAVTTATTRSTDVTAAGSGDPTHQQAPSTSARPYTTGNLVPSNNAAVAGDGSTATPRAVGANDTTTTPRRPGSAGAPTGGQPPPANQPGPARVAGPNGDVAAGPPSVGPDSGTSVVPLLIGVLMIAALAGAIVVTRIRRNASFA